MNQRILKFRAWDGTAIIKSDDWPNLSGFFGTRNKDEIIMQFTGLKDKNGKEIYEGDIVKHRKLNKPEDGIIYGIAESLMNELREVKYEGCGFTPLAGWIDDAIKDMQWEIIGNIYENPNLIKEDEK